MHPPEDNLVVNEHGQRIAGGRGLPWVLLGLFLLLTALGYWLARLNGSEDITSLESLPLILGFVSFAVVGSLIVSRHPRHPIGWLFSAIGIIAGLSLVSGEYVRYTLRTNPGSLPAPGAVEALSALAWTGGLGCILLTLLLVPTGRLPSRRWRPVAWMAVAGLFMINAREVFWPGPMEEASSVRNPLGIEGAESVLRAAETVGTILALIALIGALVSIVVRYRRSRGQERLQLKWFVFAIAFIVATLPLSIGLDRFLPEWVNSLMFAAGIAAVPVGTGVAILRYRLYGIDLIINKTVVYGGLAAFITAVYAGIVVGIGALVGAGDKPNLGLSLAATAIVAVAFQPVRQRVERFANKLVYGERVTPYEAVTSFSHRMAESLSLDQVLPQMAEAAAKGVGGTRSRVRLFLPGGGEQVVHWPPDSQADSFDRSLEVIHQAEVVGEISVAKAPGEQVNKSEEKLLTDLASQAGLAMRNLRLTGELQQKLLELQESRKRIVAAQDEERRRMERDIHDGAQQQLVSMAVKLGLAKNIVARDAQKASALLEEVKKTNDEAVETLRDLARGLFPQILTERGIGAALATHIGKMDLGAAVDDQLGETRFDLEVEANVYFCMREALQNATKYAPGAPTLVTLRVANGELQFSVKDEGPGFDPSEAKAGSGLHNMRDRIETLGGTFEIRGGTGRGTEIRGTLAPATIEISALSGQSRA